MNTPPKRMAASHIDTNGRTRAISTSQIQMGATHNLPRKTSSLSAKASLPLSQKRSAHTPSPLELSDKPNRTRKINDMGMIDIMNDSDDEKSESRTLSNFKTPRPPKISKSARDLIDFLDQGPPVDFTPPRPPHSPATSSFKSAGRFQRMMSKLTGSPSSEKLREEGAKLRRTPVVNTSFNNSNGATNPPQTPVKQVPAVVVATPPPRLLPVSPSQQATPPRSPTVNHDSSRLIQRKTSIRKKVPPLHPEMETSAFAPRPPSVSRVLPDEPSRPPALTDGNEQLNGINETAPPSFSLPEPEPRSRTSVDTIASDKIVFRRPTPTPPSKITVEIATPASTPLPVPAQQSSPQDVELSLNATHAQSLRQLMSTATTADECRVLVDMFLARVGFPVDRSTNVDPYPSPISSTDPSDVDLESSVIETLLGGDSSSAPSTAIHSALPSEVGQADESEVGTSDADTFDEIIDSPVQRSPSRILRDARVNRPLPPSGHLLTVV
jgi:hypothetical protein